MAIILPTTITPPAAYSSVKEAVIFGIDRDYDAVAEVQINGYLKQMPKNVFKVNVAHYFRDDFTIVPLDVEPGLTLQAWNGVEIGRVVSASIIVDRTPSDEVPLLCADKQPAANRFMSDLRRRNAMPGQLDELAVYVTGPAVVACGADQLLLTEGMHYVGFRIPEHAPEHFEAQLRSLTGEVLDRITYRIEPSDGVRLAWINAYGAIDYWNFGTRRKTSTKFNREKIYTEQGYSTTSLQADTTQTVSSRPMPQAQTEVLSRIFRAEAVWLIDGERVCPIDITTESVTTYDAEKLSSIQVEYRNKIR